MDNEKDAIERGEAATGMMAVDPQVKPAISDLDDAKRFLAAGYSSTAAEWLVAEVEFWKCQAEKAFAEAEVGRLTGETKILDGQIRRWRLSSNRHLSKLIQAKGEIKRLTAENCELSQHVCDECDPENYGWVLNRVEGRGACTCMIEAEPFQILLTALETISKAATGEIQIADDDTAGMAWIAKEALTALRSVLPLDYAESEPYDADMEREY